MLETQMHSQLEFLLICQKRLTPSITIFDKLEHYSVRGIALQWFKSYLHNRSQYVVYNGLQSAKLGIKFGVPQGSILGPMLILIYKNDITNASRLLQLLLFADHTNIFLDHKDIEALVATVNSELVKRTGCSLQTVFP